MFKAAWLQKGDPDLHFWFRNLKISYIGKMLTYFTIHILVLCIHLYILK